VAEETVPEPTKEPSMAGEGSTARRSREGASPYSTGGGGVTLERRVGAVYLARMLTGDGAPELGDARAVRVVAFQQTPQMPVDDLVIEAARPDETEPSLVLAIGIRRRPNLVRSNDDAQKLVAEYLRAVIGDHDHGREVRLALAVGGRQPHPAQVAELAELARRQADAGRFFDLVVAPRFRQDLVGRLEQLQGLARAALPSLGIADPHDDVVREHTWNLLRRLWVLMPEVEDPDTSDWADTQNRLMTVAHRGDLVAAGHLLDRLETLAGQYGPSGATVDRTMLRRDVHGLLDDSRTRHRQAWELLEVLQGQAQAAVRHHLGEGTATLRLDRTADRDALLEAANGTGALIVVGESGVGKSAIVLDAMAGAVDESSGQTEAICLNLRQLPESAFELVRALGCPLETLLSELSAPRRFLVVDAADAATEMRRDLFTYLVDAARASDLRLIAVTSADAAPVVRDLAIARLDADAVVDHTVQGLDDRHLQEVAEAFPSLAQLVASPRPRELLRRLVVVDLLVRSEVSGLPLSDVDAMRQVWRGLVRNHGRRDRGLPDAREQVLLFLAERELSQRSARDVAGLLDASAVDGLRQDGLLRTAENPWQVVPEFSHDELRRYAVARLLLADGTPGQAVLEVGAPRWALSATRLACQALLDSPDSASTPVRGRFARLQAVLDDVVEAGHGARWADLPAEALLTLGDPGPVLADAWAELSAGDGTGVRRVIRLINQRHRDAATHLVDAVVAEPVVRLLLDESGPWRGSEDVAKLLREWLIALVARDEPAGHLLRVRLREELVAFCDEAERRLSEREEAAAAERATRVPDDAERERERLVRESERITAIIGRGRRRRRDRKRVPREVTDDTVLELFGLLGPDLGESGEQILRRVARDAPWELDPALEGVLKGKAIGSYGHGLLADLVEAYYIDEDEDGSGLHEDGVRDHSWGGLGIPMAAWYRGPFVALWQTDFRRGVVVLNRLLNHAARARVRTLAGIGNRWSQLTADEIEATGVELEIAGERGAFAGDDQVWRWYRGTGVGPYPCMSALQALERFCDQLISAGIPPDRLVPILLEGCENLAMPGLVVGLIVRHLERAGSLLDPYLAEPLVWRLEFTRVVSESSFLAATSEGLVEPERRRWSLREAATWLTVQADPTRADELRAVGDQLVARAVELERQAGAEGDGQAGPVDDATQPVSFTTTARNWASTLDRGRYRSYTDGGISYVQSIPPEDVEAALRPGNEDLQRGQEATNLLWRHFDHRIDGQARREPPTAEELARDAELTKTLFEDPPVATPVGLWDVGAAVAADVLEGVLVRGLILPEEATQFAVEVILSVAEGASPSNQFEFEGSLFEQGADRSAARALPLLLLSAARRLREAPDREDGTPGDGRVLEAGLRLAQAIADETRLFLARALDPVWHEPCATSGRCHHELGLEITIESMRDSVFGDWDMAGQRRRIERLDDPVAETLARVADESIFVSRLDAAIRATGAAAVARTCVRRQARELLLTLIAAQRRGLLAHDHHFDERGSHALVAARALLGLAATGDDAAVREHIAAYADHSAALASLLRGLAAAAAETALAAATARRVWPVVMTQVLELNRSGHQPFADHYFGKVALAALVPRSTNGSSFIYWEVSDEPLAWADPLGWETEIDAWLAVAAGQPECVDAMIGLVRPLPEAQQVAFGLPRIAMLVNGDINTVSRQSYLLTDWLTDIRTAADQSRALLAWQTLVDALVVAGNTSLASYSD
jgi:hypothetical protein